MAATKRKKTSSSAKSRKTTTKSRKTSTTKAKKSPPKARASSSSKTKSKTKKSAPTRKASTKISKAMTRAQQVTYIAEQTGISKSDVNSVLECFEPMIASHLRGPGQINLAGLMKVVAVRKPATKARKGINPFTGEETIFKAKPARNVVKVRPLKKVKDLVG